MRTWLLLALSAGLIVARPSPAPGQTEPRAILEKALKAHGGDEKMLRLKAVQTRSKGTFYTGQGEITFTDETQVLHPHHLRSVKHLEANGMAMTQVLVLNGDKAWIVLGDTPRDLEEAMVANLRDNLFQDWAARIVPLLHNPDVTLTALPATKVGGKEAAGVQVASKGHRDVRLYFDRASGLLVKIEARAYDPMSREEVDQERFVSDYKEVAGVKRPTRVVVHRQGQKFLEMEITDVKLGEKLDETLFAKPQ